MAAPFWQQAARQMGGFPDSPLFAMLQRPRVAAGRYRRRQPSQPDFTPEEEESILRKAAGATVGSLSMASAALDVPGGAVRNILSGRAPSINPLSWEGRTTGRELLEQYNVLGPNRPGFLAPGGQWYDPTDWDWGDIAGLGTEIALDPWTYFTFGGAAVSRAGKAMKAAGLWDFLPGAAAKAGVKGRMATRMKMTPRMVLKELPKDIRGPAARQFVTQARQQGVRAATLADEPLGGATRFWPTGGVVGKAEGIGGRVASVLDPIGEAIRYGKYSPVRPAYAAFSKPLRSILDPAEQKILAAQHVEGEFRLHQVRVEGQIELSKLKDANLLGPEDIKLHRAAVEAKEPADVAAALSALPEGIARDSAIRVRASAERLLGDEQFAGLATEALEDVYAEYARRGMVAFDTLPEIGRGMGRLRATHPSQRARWENYKNWPRGSRDINKISKDPNLSGTYWRLGGPEQQPIGRNMSLQTRRLLEGQYQKGFGVSRADAIEMVRQDYPVTSRGGVDLDDAVRYLKEHYLDKLPDNMEEEEMLAFVKRASEWDPQHVSTQIPLFGNHPAFDAYNRELFSVQAINAANAIYDIAADSAKHFKDMPAGARESLFDVLQRAKLTGSGANKQMLNRLPKDMLRRFATTAQIPKEPIPKGYFRGPLGPLSERTILSNIYIPQQTANDIVGLGRTLSDPSTLRGVDTALGAFWDSWINLFKGHVTAYWPAFISRNLISGQLQNLIGGAYSLNPFARDGMFHSLRDVKEVMLGRDIPDVLEIPMIKAARITDPHEATRRVLASLSAGEIGGRYQMEHAAQVTGLSSRTIEELLGGMPSHASLNLRRKPGRNWWKPWEMRGVGTEFFGTGPKRESSEFLLGMFGEDAGYVVETFNRFGPGLAMLRRGIDPMEVVKRVKLLQVDYMTQAIGDKYIRRAVPFWTFVKGMTKFMATELSQRPGGPLAQVIRSEAALQRGGLPPALPEHIKRTAAIPLGEAVGGGENVLTSLGMMHEDPLQFLGGVTTRGVGKAIRSIGGTAWGEMLSRLGPQISVPIELGTGRSLWQAGPRGGRALVDQYGHVGGLLGQALGRQVKLPPVIEEMPQLLGVGRWLSSAGKITDPRKTPIQKAINLLTGAHLATVSPKQQERVIQESVEEMMVDLGAREFKKPYFPDWFMSGLPPAAQQKRREVELIQRILNRRWRERGKREAVTRP